MSRAAAVVLAIVLLAQPTTTWAAEIDTTCSRIGFSLQARWGQVLDGHFPAYQGEVQTLPDGRRQVRLSLATREVEIVGYPTYSRITRGSGFFDAERYPEISFVSQPYTEQLIRAGGKLAGTLRIRGIERREVFVIEPAACLHPGLECDVVASGDIRRSDYDMNRWSFAIADRIRFSLRIRTREATR